MRSSPWTLRSESTHPCASSRCDQAVQRLAQQDWLVARVHPGDDALAEPSGRIRHLPCHAIISAWRVLVTLPVPSHSTHSYSCSSSPCASCSTPWPLQQGHTYSFATRHLQQHRLPHCSERAMHAAGAIGTLRCRWALTRTDTPGRWAAASSTATPLASVFRVGANETTEGPIFCASFRKRKLMECRLSGELEIIVQASLAQLATLDGG